MKSCEQGGMHSNAYKLFLNFKTALFSSAVVVKGFNIVESCFKLKLLL